MAKVTFDAQAFIKALETYPQNVEKGVEAMGVAILTAAQKRIYNSGPGWAPWSKNYKPKNAHQMLWDSGTLLRSLTRGDSNNIFEQDGMKVTVGSNVAYAAAQQYGYPPRNLPGRPYLVVDDETSRGALEAFTAQAFKGWK